MTVDASNDLMHRFQLERASVRGAFVRLERTWRDVAANGVYPAPVLEATAGSVERILESVQTAAGLDLTAFWPW